MTTQFLQRCFLGSLIVSFISVSAFAAGNKSIEERIAPVGKVCMAGDDCAASVVAGGGEPRTGQAVYDSKCSACHSTGAAGAPKLGDAAQWGERLAARGLEALYTNAIDGYKAMPAKGLCGDCSDDEIKVSVDYILAGSK